MLSAHSPTGFGGISRQQTTELRRGKSCTTTTTTQRRLEKFRMRAQRGPVDCWLERARQCAPPAQSIAPLRQRSRALRATQLAAACSTKQLHALPKLRRRQRRLQLKPKHNRLGFGLNLRVRTRATSPFLSGRRNLPGFSALVIVMLFSLLQLQLQLQLVEPN